MLEKSNTYIYIFSHLTLSAVRGILVFNRLLDRRDVYNILDTNNFVTRIQKSVYMTHIE